MTFSQLAAAERWVRAGLLALPAYAILTIWSSLGAQPDQVADPAGWAHFVSTRSYFLSHLLGSLGGTVLAVFGTFALGVVLAETRTARLGLWGMVVAALGHMLLFVPAVISTMATPAIGRAYLAGVPDVMRVEFPASLMMIFLLGLVLALTGNVMLGVAVARSGVLPRLAGILWLIAAVAFYLLGVVLGLVAGNASLPTQSASALLTLVSGGWIAWSALRGTPTAGGTALAGRPAQTSADPSTG